MSKTRNKNALEELAIWKSNNQYNDFKIVSFNNNKLIVSMTHGTEHIIEIECPNGYPEIRKGFSCYEISENVSDKLNFILKANEQFKGKILSLDKILTHLYKTFENYKRFKKIDDSHVTNNTNSTNTNHVIFKSSIDVNPWLSVTEDNKIPIESHQNLNNFLSSNAQVVMNNDDIEMVDLDPKSNSIAHDIQILNNILGTDQETAYFDEDKTNFDVEKTNFNVEKPMVMDFFTEQDTNQSNDQSNDQENDQANDENIIEPLVMIDLSCRDKNDQIIDEIIASTTISSPNANTIQNNNTNSPQDLDDRPLRDELFDIGAENIVRRNKSKPTNRNLLKPANKLPDSTGELDYNKFVTDNAKEIEKNHPEMEEDEIMNLIQRRWKKINFAKIINAKNNSNVNTKNNSNVNTKNNSNVNDSESDSDDAIVNKINNQFASKKTKKVKHEDFSSDSQDDEDEDKSKDKSNKKSVKVVEDNSTNDSDSSGSTDDSENEEKAVKKSSSKTDKDESEETSIKKSSIKNKNKDKDEEDNNEKDKDEDDESEEKSLKKTLIEDEDNEDEDNEDEDNEDEDNENESEEKPVKKIPAKIDDDDEEDEDESEDKPKKKSFTKIDDENDEEDEDEDEEDIDKDEDENDDDEPVKKSPTKKSPTKKSPIKKSSTEVESEEPKESSSSDDSDDSDDSDSDDDNENEEKPIKKDNTIYGKTLIKTCF